MYVLLYVDKHDDAYDWAKNRKILVNPEMVRFRWY